MDPLSKLSNRTRDAVVKAAIRAQGCTCEPVVQWCEGTDIDIFHADDCALYERSATMTFDTPIVITGRALDALLAIDRKAN